MANYRLTENYRVDFTAYAPLHTFKGWSSKGLESEIEIDFEKMTVNRIKASAQVCFFETGDRERDRAMMKYMDPETFSEATIEMTECGSFTRTGPEKFSGSALALLSFMGVCRQLPVAFTAERREGRLFVETSLKWSFGAYGLKAPRLLFLTVRDIVDISGHGEFILVNN